jgi:hypothetical protein
MDDLQKICLEINNICLETLKFGSLKKIKDLVRQDFSKNIVTF